jgi:hypothetical protein
MGLKRREMMTYASAPEDIKRSAEILASTFMEIFDGEPAMKAVVEGFIAAALLNERAKAGWQDISTAPKDGTVVDLWRGPRDGYPGHMAREAKWVDGYWWWKSNKYQEQDDNISHWMPIPPPPATE